MKKRLLSFVLALVILVTSVDVTVLAEDITSVNMNTVESNAISENELIETTVDSTETTVTDTPVTSITDTKTSATSGVCGDNLTWSYTNKTLTISGTGAMYDYTYASPHGDTAPWASVCWEDSAKNGGVTLVIESGITRIGENAFYTLNFANDVTIPEGVTTIGAGAFSDTSYNGKNPLPSTLKSIEADAFSYCEDWYGELVLPNGVETIESYAFYGCKNLTGNLIIPDSVTSIGTSAFNRCENFSGVAYVPPTVTFIDDSAFGTITKICGKAGSAAEAYATKHRVHFIEADSSEDLPEPGNTTLKTGTCGTNLTWALNTKAGILRISGTGKMKNFNANDVAGWDDYASTIKTIYLEEGMTSIGDYAFMYISNLTDTEVTIPSTVTYIGAWAFYLCNMTGDLVIPDGVTEIGDEAFYGCNNLSGVAFIPASVTSIGWDALNTIHTIYGARGTAAEEYAAEYGLTFIATNDDEDDTEDDTEEEDDTNLLASGTCGTNLTFTLDKEYNLVISGTGAMKNYIDDYPDWYDYATDIKSIVISEGVTTIGAYSFMDTYGLTNTTVTIPSTVTNIGEYAFLGCNMTGDLVISSNVTKIGAGAFAGCSNLSGKAYVPANVTNIGDNAFETITEIHGTTGSAAEEYAAVNGIEFVVDDELEIIDSGVCGDNLTWELTEDYVLTISGTGAMEDYDYVFTNRKYPGWHLYKSEITKIVLNEGITSIGNQSFEGISNLNDTELVLPSTLVTIGEWAFYDTNISGNLIIPTTVTTVNSYAFASCDNLSGIAYIPSNVTSIGYNPFSTIHTIYGEKDSVAHEYAEEYGLTFIYENMPQTIASGTCGNRTDVGYPEITWTITDDGVLKFKTDPKSSKTGWMKSYSKENPAPWLEYVDCFDKLVIGKNIDNIGAYSFYNPAAVKDNIVFVNDVVIPESVTSIDEYAFWGCKFASLTFESNNFWTIGREAFSHVSISSELVLPSTVGNIYSSAFEYSDIKSITIPSGKIWDKAFYHCDSLETVILGTGVTEIGKYAFYKCPALKTPITFPEGLKVIDSYAFYECKNLTGDIILPESLETLGNWAFAWCCGLNGKIEIKSNVTAENYYRDQFTQKWVTEYNESAIADDAFYHCCQITEVNMSDDIKTIGEWAFADCHNLETIHLSTSLETIESDAFVRCHSIKSLTFPDSLRKIEQEAFYECTGLESVTFNEGLEFIGGESFMLCSSLTGDIVIPSTVSKFNGSIFGGCGKLSGVIYIPETVELVGTNPFGRFDTVHTVPGSPAWELAKDLGLTVIDSRDPYTVTFDANGGSEVVVQTVKPDSCAVKPENPTHPEYAFDNWYLLNEDGETVSGTPYDFETPVTGNITLVAKWVVPVKVTFDADNGSEVTVVNVVPNETVSEIDVPTKAGYYFLGWYLGDEAYDFDAAVTEDITLVAKWHFMETIAAPIANVPSGTEFYRGTLISLTSETPGALIYYTMDESEPTVDTGILYRGPFTVDTSVTIKAIAVKDEMWHNSSVASFVYTVPETGDVLPEDIPEGGVAAIPEGLWIAGVKDSYEYTGTKIVPVFRVYDHMTLLKEKTDYTVAYKNNVKANDGTNSKTAPTITITGKGNYTGKVTKTFAIAAKSIEDADVSFTEILVKYNGKVQKGAPVIKWNKVTLKNKTDYTLDYIDATNADGSNNPDAYKMPGDYFIVVTGKGNYTGTVYVRETVTECTLMSKVSVAKIANQVYTGEEIKPAVTVKNGKKVLEEGLDYWVYYEDNKEIGTATAVIVGQGDYIGEKRISFKITGTALSKMKMNGFVSSFAWNGEEQLQNVTFSYVTKVGNDKVTNYLVEGTDYIVTYANNKEVGTATVTYTGIGAYTGTIKKTYKITGIALSGIKVTSIPKSMVYTGNEITVDDFEADVVVTKVINKETVTLTENVDYVISYTKNVAKGTATVVFTGINRYTGTVKKTFSIKAYSMATLDGQVTVSIDDSYKYAKGGVKPEPVVMFGNVMLKKGVDYTVSYKNNAKVNDGLVEKTAPRVIVTGKGNYTGSMTVYFAIEMQSFESLKMTAVDKTYANKVNAYKSTPVIKDFDGKTLKAGTDYEKAFMYTYKADTVVKNGNVDVTRLAGDVVHSKDIVPANTVLIVTAIGKGNYTNNILSAEYRVTAAAISKVTVTVPKQTYTGKEIMPGTDKIVVKIGKTVLTTDDYEIVGYSNNVKKGTATLTIKGKGNYGGTKAVKFTIQAKKLVWYWDVVTMSFRLRDA